MALKKFFAPLALALAALLAAPAFADGTSVTYSRDERPVDGAYVGVRLTPAADGLWSADYVRKWYDRVRGQEAGDSTSLAEGLSCVFGGGAGDAAQGVLCSRDDRPVDGELTEITVAPEGGGRFAATMRVVYFDWRSGEWAEMSETIATGLSLEAGEL